MKYPDDATQSMKLVVEPVRESFVMGILQASDARRGSRSLSELRSSRSRTGLRRWDNQADATQSDVDRYVIMERVRVRVLLGS